MHAHPASPNTQSTPREGRKTAVHADTLLYILTHRHTHLHASPYQRCWSSLPAPAPNALLR